MKLATLILALAVVVRADEEEEPLAAEEEEVVDPLDDGVERTAIDEEEAKAAADATINACPEDGCVEDNGTARCCG